MTRTRGVRSSKKKLVKSSQESIPGYCKENSPSILSQNSRRAAKAQNKLEECKENISPRGCNLAPVLSDEHLYSPVRRSRRGSAKEIASSSKTSERSVLSDTTNSSQPVLNKSKIVHKLITVPKPSTSTSKTIPDHENPHIPVYKSVYFLKPTSKEDHPPYGEKEAVYEFEVDENEEPTLKKKRKKRAYTRKPKIGPKALTINNIKYSSTESLASLPDKPVCRKKMKTTKPKCNLKPSSSVVTLNDTCVSVPSFMSHPPLPLCVDSRELSVLQETQSEQCPSPESSLLEPPVVQNPAPSSIIPSTPVISHHSHFSPNPRCYRSKSNRTPNPYTNDQNSITDLATLQRSVANISSGSHDFLSSTPCKRYSQIVQENSVFDDTPGIRSSVGNASSSTFTEDNCFGFDEPEELEEPLVSPIKRNIDLKPRRVLKTVQKFSDWEEPKPSIQEVIELLKANIPKPVANRETTIFESSRELSQPTSPTVDDCETPVFVKPPRRSYERQRRVRYNSSSEEEEEVKPVEEVKKSAPKENKKCYKPKANVTKTAKAPRVTKAKQKIAKEEEELEKLAAQMNAQFQEIDKVSLVVE